MNVLIVDFNKIDIGLARDVVDHVREVSGTDDWIALPKGVDILQDMPIEWMRHLRDRLDEKIKALESDVNGENINC